jgi:hypothetical protein
MKMIKSGCRKWIDGEGYLFNREEGHIINYEMKRHLRECSPSGVAIIASKITRNCLVIGVSRNVILRFCALCVLRPLRTISYVFAPRPLTRRSASFP